MYLAISGGRMVLRQWPDVLEMWWERRSQSPGAGSGRPAARRAVAHRESRGQMRCGAEEGALAVHVGISMATRAGGQIGVSGV